MAKTQQLHRPKQCAALLGVSIATFYRIVKDGHIKTVKIGKRATGVPDAELVRFQNSINGGDRGQE